MLLTTDVEVVSSTRVGINSRGARSGPGTRGSC